MPIQFSCPTCGKSLKAPEASAGEMAKCPYCQTHVQVPEPIHEAESVPPSRPAGPPPLGQTADTPSESEPAGNQRACPACGEMIKPQAVKCRFCGEVLDPMMRRRQRTARSEEAELGAGAILFCIFLSPIAYIVSLVWILQDNPKGLKLFALASLVATAFVILGYCIALIAVGQQGAMRLK